MSIPTYDRFVDPILRYLAGHPDGAPTSIVYEAVADALGIDENEKLALLPSKTQPVYKNRAGWAHDRLKRAGLSSSPRRGYRKLTDNGFAFAHSHPHPLADNEIRRLTVVDPNIRLRTVSGDTESNAIQPAQEEVASWGTPDDQLEDALTQLEEWTAEELLEQIGRATPKFFEMLVLKLLHAMGFGANEADLQHVGGSGDGGIDGIISLDRLGLEKVFIQAKRWHNPVGPEAVQAFYGALEGRRASKGVFITTASFTSGAREFAKLVEKIRLIDGAELTKFMIEYGVGVSHRIVKVPSLDRDFFDE